MKCELRLNDRTWDLDIPPSPRTGFVWPSLYICPHCCEAWAQIWIRGHWNPTILEIPCLECTKPFRAQTIPGSLIYCNASSGELDLRLLRALPRELLDRELNLHILAQGLNADERTLDLSIAQYSGLTAYGSVGT